MGAMLRALNSSGYDDIEAALHVRGCTSQAMLEAITGWFTAWFAREPDGKLGVDPCQRLPYAIVNKLCKAIFDTQLDTSGFSSGTGDINKQFDTIRKGAESAASGMEQLPAAVDKTAASASRLSDIVKGGGALKLLEKGVNAVTASLDSAIGRYDTMNRFPMMMEQLGYGADEAEAAVQRLSGGIQGLPTTLDSVVSTAQRLTILTGNLDGAVDTTLALNNAFLASGSSSDGAARGLEQYVQALSRGKFEAEEWKTMQETMGLALTRVAESFGFAGESAQTELYAALQSGEIRFSQFNDRLIQLNNGLDGFAALAKTSSVGIQTALTNMGTAMVRGTTTMIGALDTGLSKTKFESIQNVIESETFRAGGQAAVNALQTELGLPEVTNAGSEMVTTMAEGVANNTALKDATTKMISEAQTAAKTQANTGGREIGLQMDNGITAGIVAGRSGVVNAMVETVREAIAAAAAEAEIHSPSHVMEDFIGMNLMKGWARGEEKGTDLVIEKAEAAMAKVQQAFANGSLAPAQIVAAMRARVAANQSRLAVPVGVAAGSAAPMPMAQTIINMNNTFNTHDSLSEAELTDETEAMAERLPWKIP